MDDDQSRPPRTIPATPKARKIDLWVTGWTMQSPRAREDLELLRDVLAGYRGEALQQRVGGSTSLAERERLFALRVGRSVYEVAMQAWSEALKIRT